MKVSTVSVPDAASNPAHPDHERWVKERTLKMEVEYAKRLGLSSRVAETKNAQMLERSARIAKDKPAALTKKKKAPSVLDVQNRTSRQQRNKERGVVVRAAPPEVKTLKASPCGRCGKCNVCKREQRVLLIIQRRKESRSLDMLALRMFVASLHAQGGSGKFQGLSRRDINRAIVVEVEAICDESVRWLGAWR